VGRWLGGEVRGVLVRGVEFLSGALHALDGVLQAAGQGVHGLTGVGQRRVGVDAQPAGVVLVLEPVGELVEQLGQPAGHAGEGGDDLGGVGRFGQAAGGGAGAVVEQPDGVRGLVGQVADGEVVGVCGWHQNDGWSSPLLVSRQLKRSRVTRRPMRS